MNNHLSHRWPTTTPAPTAAPAPPPPRPKKKRRGLKTFLIVLACIIGAAALAAGAYFGIIFAAEQLSARFPQAEQKPSVSAPAPAPSFPAAPDESGSAQWTTEDFPWGSPDPSVTISLSPSAEEALTPQEVYTQALPSVVCVMADHGRSYSVGSGIILTSDGYIVTNYHVVEGGTSLSVMLLPDETVYEDARIIGFDEELDIAVLKISADGLTAAVLADSDQLSVGDTVYAIGNPMGNLYGTMSDGIVSALARQVELGEYSMTLIQTSVPLNSGNSGGALVNAAGQVVGIAVAKMTGMSGDTVIEGIGLAIPITDTLPFINHIIHTGTSCRPSLGIMCFEALLEDGQRGIWVDETTPNTPAARALRPGDLIIAANGTPVAKLYDLTRILYATGVGNKVDLTVLRNGQEINVPILLYDRLAN